MLNTQLHRQTMLLILKKIYAEPSLATLLGFKGGTACYLLYGLPRFSVDLDFDLLRIEHESVVFDEMKRLLAQFGTLEDATNKKSTLFYLLSYQPGLHKIKVDISKRSLGSSYEPKQHLGIAFLVMRQADMMAHKLVALMDRKHLASRDLFDLFFFFSNRWPINTRLVEERTGISYAQYLTRCLTFIESIPERTLLTGIGELVDGKTKQWIKARLKAELHSLLSIQLDALRS